MKASSGFTLNSWTIFARGPHGMHSYFRTSCATVGLLVRWKHWKVIGENDVFFGSSFNEHNGLLPSFEWWVMLPVGLDGQKKAWHGRFEVIEDWWYSDIHMRCDDRGQLMCPPRHLETCYRCLQPSTYVFSTVQICITFAALTLTLGPSL